MGTGKASKIDYGWRHRKDVYAATPRLRMQRQASGKRFLAHGVNGVNGVSGVRACRSRRFAGDPRERLEKNSVDSVDSV
jgi:hypothetical protein